MNLQSILKNKKSILILSIQLLVANSNFAESINNSNNVSELGNGLLQVLLLVIIAILGLVMWWMGQVIIALSKQLVEKEKKKSTGQITVLILFALCLLSSSTFAQENNAQSTFSVEFAGINESTIYILLSGIVVEIFSIFYLAGIIKSLYKRISNEPIKIESKKSSIQLWNELDKKFFTKAVAVEREADVLLDHDYDGIRELDNALPPWWKYGFYATIVIAVIYLFVFHVAGIGKNPTEEYEAQMADAKIQIEKYEALNKDKVDETNVPMADAAGLSRGKEIFEVDCFPCHGKLGEGGAGPNLTDDYWLHKGSLNDIFQSVKHGYPDKGMQAWSIKFNPKEISEISSYIKTLHGSNPPGAKAAQGDLFSESIVTDSSSLKKDSIAIAKK
jgi:cytochrome c oxidase cbb3-type subunit 3